MSKAYKIIIAGGGGIGTAVGLILRELCSFTIDLYIGDSNDEQATKAADCIYQNSAKPGWVQPFHLPASGINAELSSIFQEGDIVLDCLPGNQSPRIAKLAKEHGLHYANLTEYVKETNEVIEIAKDAETGFILQTGLAPGFIDVLAHGLYQEFCRKYGVEIVDYISIKVGALTQNSAPPHFYGFTWSPIGVATEYVKPAIVIRDFKKTTRPSLSERALVIIDGVTYEEDLTSGGAADLPSALEGKAKNLDYKTLRYPGHFDWIDNLLAEIQDGPDRAKKLQEKLEEIVPLVQDDIVVIHASVQGRDCDGRLRLKEKTYRIEPIRIGGVTLRAIQATTAAALAESARMLLSGVYSGVILQSQIPPDEFLNGPFVSAVYH